MKLYPQPSGLTKGLDFVISADWTPQQAFAVVEVLDDLRDRICAQYGPALFELMREQNLFAYQPDTSDPWSEEPPF